MKRFILSLGAMAVLFGALSSPLLAAPSRGGRGSSGRSAARVSPGRASVGHANVGHANVGHVNVGHGGHVADFHGLHHGPGGYLGRDYHGWRGSYYNAFYRCTWFFCPEAGCYYYWYAPGLCYLPVSQIALYPPTVVINNNVAPLPVP